MICLQHTLQITVFWSLSDLLSPSHAQITEVPLFFYAQVARLLYRQMPDRCRRAAGFRSVSRFSIIPIWYSSPRVHPSLNMQRIKCYICCSMKCWRSR